MPIRRGGPANSSRLCRVSLRTPSAKNLLHLAYDVLIIGSGLPGMSAALHLAGRYKVALVTKHELLDGASSWAQGGIAAVLDQTDPLADHVRDTHVAGAGLCHDDAVRFVVERGRRSVEWLVSQGVHFTRDAANADRKIAVPHYLRAREGLGSWRHQIWICHLFRHPRYNDFVGEQNQQLPLRA